MAGPAKRLQTVWVEGVLPGLPLKRGDVIAFQFSGPAALGTAPAVAREDGAPDGGPAAGIQVDVAAAHSKWFDLRAPLRIGELPEDIV